MRLSTSVTALAQQALDLHLDCFQFFLTASTRHKNYLAITKEDARSFNELRASFKKIYIHSSYWINPATNKPDSAASAQRLLTHEASFARKLGINCIVVHPGSTTGFDLEAPAELVRITGIENVARTINTVNKLFPDITIVLENTAHGNRSIGSNLDDFTAIKQYLDRPEQVRFCFDTAHAFVYGYPFDPVEDLVKTIDATMGLDSLELIHLNDSQEEAGSKKDRHLIPGQGKIGKEALIALISHPTLQSTPLIIESPLNSTKTIEQIIADLQLC